MAFLTPPDLKANSYGTVAEYTEYLSEIGLEPADAEQHLIRAAQWLDREHKFIGFRAEIQQRLEWPRYDYELGNYSRQNWYSGYYFDRDGIYGLRRDENDIPENLKYAQFEMAYMIQNGHDPLPIVSTGAVKSLTVTAGPVSSSTAFVNTSIRERYLNIIGLLRDLVEGSDRLVRA